MIEIPEIFNPKIEDYSNVINKINLNENVRWIEFTAQLSQFNQTSIPDTIDHLNILIENEYNPGKLASLYTGLAKCFIGEGDFIKGAQTLGYAHQLIENDAHKYKEVKAFILLEMVGFLGIISNHSKAILILELIPNYTNSKYLLMLVEYYKLVQYSRLNKLGSLKGLIQSSKYFQSINCNSTLAYHFKTIGNLYSKRKDLDSAMNYYKKGINIADENGYTHIKAAINHDVGMLKFAKGDFQDGIFTLRETAEIAESAYTQSFTLANIGFIYKHKKELDTAEKYFNQAYKIAFNSGVFYLIPGISFYLGYCHEKKSNISTANSYYEQAYLAAIELVENNFECRGDIKNAIKNYLPFLKKYQNQLSGNDNIKKIKEFLFVKDKSLTEIREIFQKSLFKYISNDGDAITTLSKKYNISVRKLYEIKSKMNNAFVIPYEIELFLKNNPNSEWKSLNQDFDQEILNCLLAENKFNKKIVAQKLDISYPNILKLTSSKQKSKYQSRKELK